MAGGFNNKPPIVQQVADNLIGGNLNGIISTRPQAKYMSGARCTLRVNGKIAAFAFGISWRIDTSNREITSIDNTLPDELIPRRISVEGSISALHIPGDNPGTNLWQPDVLSFLFHQYIQIEVRDSQTNQLIFYTPRAVITSRQEEIKVDQLASVQLSFMAIGWKDEKEPSLPDGINSVSPDAGTATKTKTGDFITNPVSNTGLA